MRIWHQSFVDMSSAPAYEAALRRQAAAAVRPDTEVVIHGVPEGTYAGRAVATTVSYAYVHHLMETRVLDHVVQAEVEGYDAFAICTLQDPALLPARSVVDIPVVGYGEAAMHLACMLGGRFGIVAFNPDLFPLWEGQIAAYGLRERAVPITPLDADYPDLVAAFDTPGRLVDDFQAAARAALTAGADVLIPGQALLGSLLSHHGVTRVDDAPVVDPLTVTIKMAEMMVDLKQSHGLSVSRRGFFYAQPPRPLVAAMRAALGPGPDRYEPPPGG